MGHSDKTDPGNARQTAEKPTLRTIAGITGLAVTTVSRALGDAPEIAHETRQRVQKVAGDIGYLPDRAAQRLRTGRTNVIALVLDPHEEILNFGTSIIKGLTEALRGTSYQLVISPHFRNEPAVVPLHTILRNRMADGVIFSRTEPFDARVKLLIERDFPFICHGRTELSTPHPFVDFDNESFAYQAASKLIGQGRRKIAILLPPDRFTFHQHMRYGFMRAVREAGVDYEILDMVTLDSPSEAVTAQVAQRLEQADSADGYVLAGEVSALAVMAALTDAGLQPGRDVGLVAKKTSNLFTSVRPQIDTIHEDLMAAGADMGRLLLKRIAGDDPQSLQSVHHPEAP